MKSLLFLLAFSVLMFGCNKTVGCKVEELMIKTSTDAVVAGLQCQNAEAVKTDLTAVIKKIDLCKQTETVGGTICKTFSGAIVDGLTFVAVPAEWQCDPTATKEKIKEIIAKSCDKI